MSRYCRGVQEWVAIKEHKNAVNFYLISPFTGTIVLKPTAFFNN